MTDAPDLSTYHAVHRALRQGAHDIAASVSSIEGGDHRRAEGAARWWRGYAGEVLLHHTVEDDFFFPALVDRVPSVVSTIDRTDADHHHLDQLMDEIGAAMVTLASTTEPGGAPALLRELAAHMDGHLDLEDREIIPLFAEHFTAEEYDELNERAVKSFGISKQMAFTVPFLAASMSDEERRHVLGTSPIPFRLLYVATKGSYARLANRALAPNRGAAPSRAS